MAGPLPTSDAETTKLRGNELFAAGDYEGAIECYTEAIKLDGTQWAYPLNRCFAYLKLQRWAEAEADATVVLKMNKSNLKAVYRRSLARNGMCKFALAREDLWTYATCANDWKAIIEENARIAVSEAAFVAGSMSSSSQGFRISESSSHGSGAFATRDFRRGDLVLIEAPLYVVHEDPSTSEVAAAVKRLSDDKKDQLSQLQNNFVDQLDDAFFGIHRTNAFAIEDDKSAMILLASRFNHSCSPNARYSWHAPSGRFRIYALRPISVGEELLVTYIAGRNVYGSTRGQRQQRLRAMLGFLCSCATCTLPLSEQAASDRRRAELKRLWESVPYFSPHQTLQRLRSIQTALELLKEEGFHADADDFTNDAAAICTYHSDWDSAAVWAKSTYASRVAEFGADSPRAKDGEIATLLVEPRKYQMAGLGTPKVFAVRPP